ncbi:hypothetical protein BJ508DRAFT_312564 [Ascobolus immersus RN42]|uniref:Uncharacterized protein n=1 Tax=Ascobolus immersus RN42 TaxID=1160509 RepID=A0A3N4HQL8_ASCIM|nr:hypothetical protein BJ508DRAFT_312564 [Ascobolus immersus RN42]
MSSSQISISTPAMKSSKVRKEPIDGDSSLCRNAGSTMFYDLEVEIGKEATENGQGFLYCTVSPDEACIDPDDFVPERHAGCSYRLDGYSYCNKIYSILGMSEKGEDEEGEGRDEAGEGGEEEYPIYEFRECRASDCRASCIQQRRQKTTLNIPWPNRNSREVQRNKTEARTKRRREEEEELGAGKASLSTSTAMLPPPKRTKQATSKK